jgi:hypothetical protein
MRVVLRISEIAYGPTRLLEKASWLVAEAANPRAMARQLQGGPLYGSCEPISGPTSAAFKQKSPVQSGGKALLSWRLAHAPALP